MFKRRSAASKPALQRGDTAYLNGLEAARLAEGAPRIAWILYLLLAIVAAVFAWAANTRVDDITRADARVVPEGREQVIASLEGGILRELRVTEGMQVDAGQELAEIDPTRFLAQQNEGRAKRLSLSATSARLEAEANGSPLVFPPEVQAVPTAVAGETGIYLARQRALQDSNAATARSVSLLRHEQRVAESMAAAGVLSDVEVMRLRRQVNDLELQSQERRNRFRQDASTELVRVRTEIAMLDEQMSGRADVLRRTVLTSPVHGLVKNIRASTVGGVIQPGAAIMEIVPIGQRVLIEARIKPADIGFIRVGQMAEVRLSAYDYATYGALKAKIDYISPDALGDPERSNASTDTTYYRALLYADRNELRAKGEPLPVLPGMNGSVEVRTGERSVLGYLLRPLLKSKEAFTEG